MITKDVNYVGKIVMLKPDFIKNAGNVDEGFPKKVMRPYLVVEIVDSKEQKQLFAVPIQTSVSKDIDEMFFEKLAPRLETRTGCNCGLLYGQMVPITNDVIDEVKEAENLVPYDKEKQKIILKNITDWGAEMVPEKARPSFNYLKKMAPVGVEMFRDKQVQQAYRKITDTIFKETIKIKNENLGHITQKTKNYLLHYVDYLRSNVYKNGINKKSVTMPKLYTRIDKLARLLNQYDAIKTSLQSQVKKLTPEEKTLMEKYKITVVELNKIKASKAKIEKFEGEKYTLESFCRASKGIPNPSKPHPKTQEKTIAKTPVPALKIAPKKPTKPERRGK